LLVSAVRHDGEDNAAGRWLLAVLLEHLKSGSAPKHKLPDDMWVHLKTKLNAEKVDLVAKVWDFKPDPNDEGLAQGWHLPELASTEGWKDIRVGRAWEGQGYPALDKWAWYRLEVDIPDRWRGRDVFLSFEGVDDCYELYINGKLAGKGGDLATRVDSFNEKKSHNITRFVKPGTQAILAVRVHDWYGAGGIFRPVTLGTIGFSPGVEMLK
jgi:beta-galactosidase/beta-glucuronidase